uniref:Fibrous sheath-interacting protein 2 n=1 Tax=Haemonchus contortus TaxID=6289 RepID=A0A7I4YT33_HAECO
MASSQRRAQKKVSSKKSCLDVPGDAISAELPGSQEHQLDSDKISAADLLMANIERNKDPLLKPLLSALSEKIPSEFSESIKSEKRPGALLSSLEEAGVELRSSDHQKDLEERVSKALDALNVECLPCEVYRIDVLDPNTTDLLRLSSQLSSTGEAPLPMTLGYIRSTIRITAE